MSLKISEEQPVITIVFWRWQWARKSRWRRPDPSPGWAEWCRWTLRARPARWEHQYRQLAGAAWFTPSQIEQNERQRGLRHTRSILLDFSSIGTSVNCLNIPFKFTNTMVDRTTWGKQIRKNGRDSIPQNSVEGGRELERTDIGDGKYYLG